MEYTKEIQDDLYEALKRTIQTFNDNPTVREARGALFQARQALAKAEGK